MARTLRYWVQKDPNGENLRNTSAMSSDEVFTCVFCRHTFHTRYYTQHSGSERCLDNVLHSNFSIRMNRRYVFFIHCKDLQPGASFTKGNAIAAFLRAFAACSQVHRHGTYMHGTQERWILFPHIDFKMELVGYDDLPIRATPLNYGLYCFEGFGRIAQDLLNQGVTDMDEAVQLVLPYVSAVVSRAVLSKLEF